jgi:zinc protease
MKHRFLASLAVAMLAMPFLLLGQEIPKIEFEKYKLANGLEVIFHVDKRIPAVTVNMWYHVGSKNERPGRTGFAHLFEHMMFQGSKHVKGEYLKLVEEAGASLGNGGVNGSTSEDRTNYFETVPTPSLEYILWLESDRMGFLMDGMTTEKFTNQQDVVKNEKRQGDNEPYNVIQYLVADNLYPRGHSYSHTVIGSLDDLTNATLDDVKEFFQTWYTPNNCTMSIVGDFDPALAKQLIQKYFGPIPAGPSLSRPVVDIPSLQETKIIRATDRVPQARLYLYYPVPQIYSKEEAPLDYAAFVLGRGKGSRLYRKLVRELQLASGVSVNDAMNEVCGEFSFVITARPNVSLDEIKKIVDEEIAKLAKDGPTEAELKREKAATAMQMISRLERLGGFGGISDILNQYNTYLGDPEWFKQDYQRYAAVTAADVKREFNKWVAGRPRLEIFLKPEASSRADAKEFDRTSVPSKGGSSEFKAPQVQSQTLENGLEVVVYENHDIPKISGSLSIKTGNILETLDKSGVSSLTAAMLDKGTKTRKAEQITEDIDLLGSTLGVGGGKGGGSINFTTLTNNLGQTMEVVADVLLEPVFPEQELDRLKKQYLDAILREKSSPNSLASRTFQRVLYGAEHPGGFSSRGTEKSIPAIKIDDLKKNYKEFWRPNNAILILCGDIKMQQAVALAKKYFGAWKKAELPKLEVPPTNPPSERMVYLVDKQDAPSSVIFIGSLAPTRYNPDYVPIEVMNTLLGGSFSSRLNMNLREEKGYTYGAGSWFNMDRYFGAWMASSSVQTKVTVPALQEFQKELEGISGAIPVKADELKAIQNNMVRSYVQNFENNGAILGQIAPLLSLGLPLKELSDYSPIVSAQTPESIMGIAGKYINFNKAIVVVVGDLSKIEQPLRDMKLGKVVVVDADGKVLR